MFNIYILKTEAKVVVYKKETDKEIYFITGINL